MFFLSSFLLPYDLWVLAGRPPRKQGHAVAAFCVLPTTTPKRILPYSSYMSQPAPTEILEYVVDLVASDAAHERTSTLLALCACCRALVPRSQKYIFRSVTLYPRPEPWESGPHRDYDPLFKRASSFASTILKNAHLRPLVKRLHVRFTGIAQKTGDQSRSIALALKHLVEVNDLRLSAQDPPSGRRWTFPDMISGAGWNDALLSLLQLPRLRRLSLQCLQNFPIELFAPAQGVRVLEMYGTRVSVGLYAFASLASTEVFRPTSLLCDETSVASMKQFSVDMIWDEDTFRGREIFSRVQSLTISVPAEASSWDHLASCFLSLRKLDLTVSRNVYYSDERLRSPLSSLPEASFATITEMHFRVVTNVERSTFDIRLPYVYDWREILPQFSQLEIFKFQHIFQGHLDVHHWSFGERWASIFTTVTDNTVCPHLMSLVVAIEARALREEDTTFTSKNMRDRERFIHALESNVALNRSRSRLSSRIGLSAQFLLSRSFGDPLGYRS
ncbi:hypothetical protein NMY22_g5755 [Coprinellus aureogranulatus]|nr:hypothetical protein NMY22_g5755 [Coprinellus aureogranulatus]